MRLIILFALASIVGYGVLQIDKLDPDNYVKMYLGNYVVELKVVQFLILIFLLVVILYFLLWLFRLLWRSPKSVGKWWHRRSRDIAEEQFGAGYLSLIKGDWRRAESQLIKNSNHSHISYVNFLAAARAAAEQGKLAKRDEYLKAAYQAAPEERLAIGLTKARLHQQAGQLEDAEATLSDIASMGANNPQYTAMSIQLFEQTKNWSRVEELLPAARKQNALPATMLADLQEDVVSQSLLSAQDKTSAFKALTRAQRKNPRNVKIYVDELIGQGDHITAEKQIRATLKTSWNDDLVERYGKLLSDKPAKLLRNVEGWLMARPENPHVNLAAGRLARSAKSYDLAKEYLQVAIREGKLPAAYSALAEVYEATNESGKALQLYRVGMQNLSGHGSKLLPQNPDDAETNTSNSAA